MGEYTDGRRLRGTVARALDGINSRERDPVKRELENLVRACPEMVEILWNGNPFWLRISKIGGKHVDTLQYLNVNRNGQLQMSKGGCCSNL